MERVGLTFHAEAARQEDDDDADDQDGSEPWLFANTVLEVVDLVRGKGRVGVVSWEEVRSLGNAAEERHLEISRRVRWQWEGLGNSEGRL